MTRTEFVRVAPPSHLMEPTAEPDCSRAETNGDLMKCCRDRLEALRRANADKAAIKESCEVGQ